MGDAKSIEVRPISSADANALVRRVHYSRKIVQNSQVHLGVFLNGRLHGAMQFGPPWDRRKVLHLVNGSTWESVIELNRMAFGEALPRNSESRALSIAFRMFRQRAPQVKWCLSFADGTQCGDGTIYRASGFHLTGIKENDKIIVRPDGSLGMAYSGGRVIDGVPLAGYQFRYIRFIDPAWRDRLAVPVIPFSSIPDDARMFRGSRLPVGGAGVHPATGGASLTQTLHEVPDAD